MHLILYGAKFYNHKATLLTFHPLGLKGAFRLPCGKGALLLRGRGSKEVSDERFGVCDMTLFEVF